MRSIQMNDISRLGAILITLAAIGGCETTPTATEADYGNSVRQHGAKPNDEPRASGHPAGGSGDGARAQNAIDVYRKDVAQPENVKKELVIGVGGNR